MKISLPGMGEHEKSTPQGALYENNYVFLLSWMAKYSPQADKNTAKNYKPTKTTVNTLTTNVAVFNLFLALRKVNRLSPMLT